MNKKALSILLILTMLAASGCSLSGNSPKKDKYSIADSDYKCIEYASMSPEEIVANL